MQNSQQIVNVMVTTAAVLGLWVLFHWIYRSYREDLFRNRLFELRQQLFDMGRNGRLDFSHPAYGVLRSTINGFIQEDNCPTLVGLVVFSLTFRAKDFEGRENYIQRLGRLSEDLPGEIKEELLLLLSRLHWFVFAHMVFTSLLCAAVALPVCGCFKLAWMLRLPEFKCWLKMQLQWLWHLEIVDRMDNAALAVGGGSVSLSPAYALSAAPSVRSARR